MQSLRRLEDAEGAENTENTDDSEDAEDGGIQTRRDALCQIVNGDSKIRHEDDREVELVPLGPEVIPRKQPPLFCNYFHAKNKVEDVVDSHQKLLLRRVRLEAFGRHGKDIAKDKCRNHHVKLLHRHDLMHDQPSSTITTLNVIITFVNNTQKFGNTCSRRYKGVGV